MTKKQKLTLAGMTDQEVGEIVGRYTAAKIEMDAMAAEMHAELDALRMKYQGRAALLSTQMYDASEAVQTWADANKDRFDKARSMEFSRGMVGFRLGNFKVVCAKGIKLSDAAQMISRLPWGKDYVRQVVELNKEALIADRENLTAAQTAKAGIAIVQEEHFFIDPKIDDPIEV